MRITSLLFIAMGLLPGLAAAEDWQPSFVAGIDGVPIMPGLSEQVDETVVFDKPEGRLVDALAISEASPADIIAWYGTALAEAGWSPLGPDIADRLLVQRDGEVLHIRVRDDEAEGVDVHFSLAPIEDDAPSTQP